MRILQYEGISRLSQTVRFFTWNRTTHTAVELARAVRETYPDISLMLDANSAYTLDDAAHLKQLDRFNLLMLEQPLAHNDIYQHSVLQSQIETPICLD